MNQNTLYELAEVMQRDQDVRLVWIRDVETETGLDSRFIIYYPDGGPGQSVTGCLSASEAYRWLCGYDAAMAAVRHAAQAVNKLVGPDRYAQPECQETGTVAPATCTVCGAIHKPCARCFKPTACDPEEPGEQWVYCNDCDQELAQINGRGGAL